MTTLVALVLALTAARLDAADPTLVSPGNVRLAKVAKSHFDAYTSNPTQAQKDWIRSHFWRMLVFSPYFDSRLSWYPDGWVYKDLYAIYVGSSLANEHPEWILRDAAGNRLYIRWECSNGTCTQYAADVGNPAFRAHWIAEAGATLAKGYRGLWVDDVNMLLDRVSNGAGQPVAPRDPRTGTTMTEASWRRYIAEFTEQIRAAFPQKEISHNALWFAGRTDPAVQRQLLAADVVTFERGFNDSGIVRGTGTYGFETLLAMIDWLHEHDRSVWLQASASTAQAREYGLATYFLVSNGRDAISNHPGTTPDDWWTGYDVSLGAALGPRYVWNGVFRRDFEGGLVLVNQPGSSQATLSPGGSYLDLSGAQRTSVVLGAAQGAVLRRAATTSAPALLDVVPLSN